MYIAIQYQCAVYDTIIRRHHVQTQVLVIGGGATGTAIARDLALRGIHCILVEKDHLNAGASGGNHGLLHSGGRYVSNDQHAAVECREEGEIIKKTAPQLVEDAGGIFVAVEGDDERFIADFPTYCAQCGITCETITPQEAREFEPCISEKAIAAYRVPDASIDPFKLCLQNINHAQMKGAILLRRAKAATFEIQNKKIKAVHVLNMANGETIRIEPEQVVNAAGAWAAEIASLAGAVIPMVYSKGTLLITNERINKRIINRLRKPSNGDILVPGGVVSVLGTTSSRVDSLDDIYPTVEEADYLVNEGAQMVPMLQTTRYIRAFSGVRPLVGSGDGRAISRGFTLVDHSADNVDNLTTITSGKLTTYRLMAEKTADMVAKKLGVDTPCITRTEPLPAPRDHEWTEPALSPRSWMKQHNRNDIMVCECEMVSKSAIDDVVASITKNNEHPRIVDIGFHTRLGRGTCQGAFCGPRTVYYMYDTGSLENSEGINDLKGFLQERWKGTHPICWGDQLIQAELAESIHCGLFGEELQGVK